MIPIDEGYLAAFWNAAEVIANTKNEVARINTEVAMDNAATNAVQTGKPPVNVDVPFKIEPDRNSFPDLKEIITDQRVTNKSVADFMPKPPSPVGVVGDGIGDKIPGTARLYYDRTNMTHEPGELKTVGSRQFKYFRPNPFGGSWQEV
jgi:hypothetical protein